MRLRKYYHAKVYRGSEYLGLMELDISGFKMSINGGLGEMSLIIPKPFSNFSQRNFVDLNNKYEIYCIDKDTSQDGVKIYSGYVYDYEAEISDKSSIKVSLTGYWNKLANSILKEATAIELMTDTTAGLVDSGAASATEISDVVTAIINRYQAEAVNPVVNYSTGSIETTGSDMTYTFLGQNYADAILKCREFSPANWWFFVGADNILQFKSKPDTATHRFILGKHFKKLNLKHSLQGVINRFILGNNNDIQKLYSDTDSSALYDDIWSIATDERVEIEATADLRGNSTIAELKDELVIITFDIFDNNFNDNGYDIESILPGDTCSLFNLDKDTQTSIDENMLIVGVSYNKDSVSLAVQTTREKIGEVIRSLQNKTYGLETKNLLSSYTT